MQRSDWWAAIPRKWSGWNVAAHNDGDVSKLKFDLQFVNDERDLSKLVKQNLPSDAHFKAFDKYDPEWIEGLAFVCEKVEWNRSCRSRKAMTRLNLKLPCVSDGKKCLCCGSAISGSKINLDSLDINEFHMRIVRWLGGDVNNCYLHLKA